MQAKPSNAAAPLPFTPAPAGQMLVEAQQTAMEMAARLSALAFKYALEINTVGFELWRRQIQHYSGLSTTLAPRQTPRQVVSAHTELIETATQDYEDGVKRIATAGTQMARETAQTLDEGRERAEALIQETTSRAPKASGRPRPKAHRGRAGR